MLLEVDIERQLPGFHCQLHFHLECERCGVFGPSGSGKSTLMSMLAGLFTPDRGHIRLNGRSLFDSTASLNLTPEKRRVGVVFQQGHLFPHMSVAKNLRYGLQRLPPQQRRIDFDQLIEVLQLAPLLTRRVTSLSGGEKQRVALGRTILASPELILLDEPLTGLDRQLKFRIIPHLRQVFSEFKIPMLFISHSLQEMRLMTEEVLVMEQGRVTEQLSSEELARSRFGAGGRGYVNLLDLREPQDRGDLLSYQWGRVKLILLKNQEALDGRFSLNSRDILLFKKHPEAASARNMLSCTVVDTYRTDWLVGVELDCQGQRFIAEVVPQSLAELGIEPGAQLVAVIKASAFRRLY